MFVNKMNADVFYLKNHSSVSFGMNLKRTVAISYCIKLSKLTLVMVRIDDILFHLNKFLLTHEASVCNCMQMYLWSCLSIK